MAGDPIGIQARQAVDEADVVVPWDVTVSNPTDVGAAITGASMPSGGSGLLGWLSALWTRLSDGSQKTKVVDSSGTYLFTSGNPGFVESSTLPATVTALPGASGAVAAGAVALVGFTARETTGSASAVVRLRDGIAGGVILATIALDWGESIPTQTTNAAVTNAAGVYVEIVSGSVEGSVLTR